MNIFERASRLKLRFNSPKGALGVEDLWDLPLTSATGKANLDAIAIELHQALKATAATVSFVEPQQTGPDSVTALAFEVVKYIIDVRVAENKAAADAKTKAETKQRLLEVLERKQNAELESKTPEEIRAMLSAL